MLAATLLAIGSAFVHAAWNLLIKTSSDRAMAAWGQFLAAALIALPVLAVVGFPGWEAVPYLAVTAAVHVAYIEALVAAYTHGDFSLSYPLARGGGAVLAAVGSVAFLGDRLPAMAWIAIAIAAAGLVSLRGRGGVDEDELLVGRADGGPGPEDGRAAARAAQDRADRSALTFAAITAGCIAAYTLIDSAGARATEGVPYALATVAASGLSIAAMNALRPARRARAGLLVRDWQRNLAGGLGTTVAYTMVLVAVRHAPVGYVTMLRESSVLIGALIGWLVLREELGSRRLASSVVILTGLVLLVAVGR